MAQYDEGFLDRLELVWGRGFLSPGGPDEVRRIVAGLDLAGARVLDIGCGLGGPAMVLAGETGARVTGIDVEDAILARATDRVAEAGLADRVDLMRVAPGRLPFADAAFDVVFSKDSLVHIPDKPAIFAEAHRVLRPGGRLAMSDWLTGPHWRESAAFAAYLALTPLDLGSATVAEATAALTAAGFEDIETADRNAWFVETCHAEQRALADGPLRAELERLAGPEGAAAFFDRREYLAEAAEDGSLRPTHLRAAKPA